MIHTGRRMRPTVARRIARAAVALSAVTAVLAGCGHDESSYQQYKGYVNDANYKNVDVLPAETIDKLAAELCADDWADVSDALDLLTKPLPNGYDTTAVGIAQAGFIVKAYCKDTTKAFYHLASLVGQRYGSAMVYAIPQ